MTTDEFILSAGADEDLATLALRVRQYPMVDAAFALTQIEGARKARTKVPEMAAIDGWIWPKRISLEQCSSEATARYKAALVQARSAQWGLSAHSGMDLTTGLGVDTFYLSRFFEHWTSVERDTELSQLAEKNFATAGRTNIVVRNAEVCPGYLEARLADAPKCDLIFLDPARRDEHGGKVFRLQDCTPDVVQLYPELTRHANMLLLKLSPMLDISEALTHLPDTCEVHVVAVRNEVKEILVLCRPGMTCKPEITLTATNILANGDEATFSFTREEEEQARSAFATMDDLQPGTLLFEPNAAIMKAGAFRLMAQRWQMKKLAPSSHLYLMSAPIPHNLGRTFRIEQLVDKKSQKDLAGRQANIICRNYPLRPEELKKKLKLKDGGDAYIIGTKLADKPIVLLCHQYQ